jgi:hypothetical protein
MSLTVLGTFLWTYKWWVLGVLAYFLFRGNTPIGTPMRRKPGTQVAPSEDWYIESKPTSDTPVHLLLLCRV